MKPPLWIPSRERLRASNLVHFAAWVAGSDPDDDEGPAVSATSSAQRGDPGDGPAAFTASLTERRDPADGYNALWRWSIEQQEAFWSALWDWCGIVGDKGGRVFVDGDHMPGARYFPDARLNFAENLLRRRTDEPAIIAWATKSAGMFGRPGEPGSAVQRRPATKKPGDPTTSSH